MEYKSGIYVVYKGSEYRWMKDPYTLQDLLISENPESQHEGFTPLDETPGLFILGIQKQDMDSAYKYSTYAIYKGRTFHVGNVNKVKDTVKLDHFGSEGADEAGILGFMYSDREWLVKRVPLTEIEKSWIEREPIWGFE